MNNLYIYTFNANKIPINDCEVKKQILNRSLDTERLGLRPKEEKDLTDAFINVEFENKGTRKDYYDNGFDFMGKHYVYYKRTASSARSGSCLFIRSDLEEIMNNWSNCGLNPESDEVNKNRLAFEAYRALTLSSCEYFFELDLKSILLIDDKKSPSRGEEIIITDKDVGVDDFNAQKQNISNTNIIWDGEGLLDKSVFENLRNVGYHSSEEKSMLLLRNKFFKSCVFNTNLTKFFSDNGFAGEIKRDENGNPTDINGYTDAKNYEDIKLVITHSSLKFLKFRGNMDIPNAFKAWKKEAGRTFGIVKSDKKTPYFNGKMVRTSYQFINTLYLSKEEAAKLAAPTVEMIKRIKTDSSYYHYILKNTTINIENAEREDVYDEDAEEGICDEDSGEEKQKYISFSNYIASKLISCNKDFEKTKYYRQAVRGYANKLTNKKARVGKLLIKGTLATLFGNPMELLRHIIKEFDENEACMDFNTVMCTAFKDGEKLVGSRSPHILPGNILMCENKIYPEIKKYFNLTDQIVVVNSIKSDIQCRLNGADFDSDFILLTDEEIIVNAVDRVAAEKFPVPVNGIKGDPVPQISFKELYKYDHKMSENNIGRIVNLSQRFNSIIWDDVFKNGKNVYDNDYYHRNCILEVLSNIEIDAAKGRISYDSKSVLDEFDKYLDGINPKKPLFFKQVDTNKGKKPTKEGFTERGYLVLGDRETKEDSSIKLFVIESTASKQNEDGEDIIYEEDNKLCFRKANDFLENPVTKKLKISDEIYVNGFAEKSYKGNSVLFKGIVTKDSPIYPEKTIDEIKKNRNFNELCSVRGYIVDHSHCHYEEYDTPMDYIYKAFDKISAGRLANTISLTEFFSDDVKKWTAKSVDDKDRKRIERFVKDARKLGENYSLLYGLETKRKKHPDVSEESVEKEQKDVLKNLKKALDTKKKESEESEKRYIAHIVKKLDKTAFDNKNDWGCKENVPLYLLMLASGDMFFEIFKEGPKITKLKPDAGKEDDYLLYSSIRS